MIISPAGKILVQAGGAEHQIISWEIERDEVVRARRNFPLFRDRRPDVYGDIAAKPEDLLN
jgi:N-carbamoylputrescine amidase